MITHPRTQLPHSATGAPGRPPHRRRTLLAGAGLAAAISGNTIEVQNPSTGQVSVTYSGTTRFTQATKGTTADLTAGECVTAVGPATAGASTATQPTSFTATSITVTPATNGGCGSGFGGGTRATASPRPTTTPSGGNRARIGAFATGTVLAVHGDTVTIHAINRATQASTTDTITTTSATTVTTTSATTSSALKVGECVSASGSANSTGTVTATRIALSTPGPNGCTTGFGRRGTGSTGGSNA